jgi:hypothetical protein
MFPGTIGCLQNSLAERRCIGVGVLEEQSDTLAIEDVSSSSALGDSVGNEKQLGIPLESQNRWFVSAVGKESQWNSARLESTRLFRVVKYGGEMAGIVIRKNIESQVVAT